MKETMPMRWLCAGALVFSTVLAIAAASMTAQSSAGIAPADPMVVAVGDIACDRTSTSKNGSDPKVCQESATATTVASLSPRPTALLLLGDVEYPDGSYEQFQHSFAKTWGVLGIPMHPAPGNHEYHTPGAAGYYRYFGAAAGDSGKGYYSYDIGAWHLIALNANCQKIGGCGHGSPEEQWLAADLAAHPRACTLAYWHQPRFSSGEHHSDTTYTAFWNDLYAAGADLVLNGHDHDYERFGPQRPDGTQDSTKGIREFVVGTGGKNYRPFTAVEPNSEIRNADTFGVLALTLQPKGYRWRFVSSSSATPFADSGVGTCHHPSI